MPANIVIFSDLDGCLLNKQDYRFDDAIPCLQRLRNDGIPLILASSKTESEMLTLAEELEIERAPIICENGGAVLWRSVGVNSFEESKKILGVERKNILRILGSLKGKFEFESFIDLGIEGVAQATNLPLEKAAMAFNRSSTEPLLWHDSEQNIDAFRQEIVDAGLTLTKGGRFWHVSGPTTKGKAMQYVMENLSTLKPLSTASIAIGDSPIDQSMLDIADYPVAIPQPDGVVLVQVSGKNSRIAKRPGAAGWADSVSEILDELSASHNSV